jgi:hypothetical protein
MDLPAGEKTNCTMQFTMGQAAIELGSVAPFILVSAYNLPKPLSQALQQVQVSSSPSVSAWISESTCTPPSNGESCWDVGAKLQPGHAARCSKVLYSLFYTYS